MGPLMSAGNGGGEEARKGPQPRSLACGGTLLAVVYLFFFLGPLRPGRHTIPTFPPWQGRTEQR